MSPRVVPFYNASAATVETELEALSNIDVGEVFVAKSIDTVDTPAWTLIFGGGLAGTRVAQVAVDSSFSPLGLRNSSKGVSRDGGDL